MRPFRIVVAVSAAALLGAACGGEDGSARADAPGTSTSAAATPVASPTGGGVADLPAAEILTRARAALTGATSVRIKGYAGAGSERTDLDLQYAGSSALGSVDSGGQRVELRRIGQTLYVKGSAEFLKAQVPDVPASVAGKWLKASLTDPHLAGLAQTLDLGKTADAFLKPDGAVTKGERKTIAGKDAIALRTAGDSGALWIATSGTPYPLQLSSSDPKDPGQISFSGYGAKVAVSPPPADQVVDIAKLGN